jgi:hypothetical protein
MRSKKGRKGWKKAFRKFWRWLRRKREERKRNKKGQKKRKRTKVKHGKKGNKKTKGRRKKNRWRPAAAIAAANLTSESGDAWIMRNKQLLKETLENLNSYTVAKAPLTANRR